LPTRTRTKPTRRTKIQRTTKKIKFP
jgi:hypothetical protein